MKLIENCKTKWWKLWSVRLAAFSAAVSAYVWSSPDTVFSILSQVPVAARIAAIAAFFGLKLLVRLVHQPKVTANAPTN